MGHHRDNIQYLWGVHQDETLLRKELLEQGAYTTLDHEDGLVDLGPKINRPVVQPCVQTDEWSLTTFLFFLLFFGDSLGRHWPFSVGHLKR